MTLKNTGFILFIFFISCLTPRVLKARTKMTWGLLTVWAEEMGIEQKGNLFFARGKVDAKRLDVSLLCDEAIFDKTKGVLKALGNVLLSKGSARLSCGFLILFDSEQRGLARMQPLLIKDLVRESHRKNPDGSIAMVNSKVALMGKEIEFFKDTEIIHSRGDAIAIEVPSYIEDQAILIEDTEFLNKIYADTIEIYGKTAKSIGRGNVRVLTEELIGTGNKGIYLKNKNRLIITGDALVFQTQKKEIPDKKESINRVRGDKIVVFPESKQTIIIGTVKSKVFQSPE
ncbi:LptA/OstA family protein [Candidatus Riflebacteria bacterium]